MSTQNKFCKTLALSLRVVFLRLAIIGLFTGCQLNFGKPELKLEKETSVATFPSSLMGLPEVYIHSIRCVGINEVAIQLLFVRAGNTEKIGEGDFSRTDDRQPFTSPCIFMLLFAPGAKEGEVSPSVGFRFGGSSVVMDGSGSGRVASLAGIRKSAPAAFKIKRPFGMPIAPGEPMVLYLEAYGSRADIESYIESYYNAEMSSVEEVVKASEKYKGLKFLVATLSW